MLSNSVLINWFLWEVKLSELLPKSFELRWASTDWSYTSDFLDGAVCAVIEFNFGVHCCTCLVVDVDSSLFPLEKRDGTTKLVGDA